MGQAADQERQGVYQCTAALSQELPCLFNPGNAAISISISISNAAWPDSTRSGCMHFEASNAADSCAPLPQVN